MILHHLVDSQNSLVEPYVPIFPSRDKSLISEKKKKMIPLNSADPRQVRN